MRLFRAIVEDQFRQEQQNAKVRAATVEGRLTKLRQQLDQLDSAFIFERRIEKSAYDRQRARLGEEMLVLDLERHELTLQKLDLEGTLTFAENVACNAARLWMEASPEQKVRLQAVYFPEGLDFDGAGFGTAATCLAFTTLERNTDGEYGVASPTGTADGWPMPLEGFSERRAA